MLGWALLGKVFPGLFPDGARVARLRNPIGYWNALALVAALALPLGLWLAAGRRHARVVRAGGIVLLYVASIALVLTYSRAGIAVAAAGVVLWLWLCRDRFEGLLMLVAGAGPGLVVAAWASTQPGLVDHLQTSATRERAGAWFALALALGVAAALALSHYGTRLGSASPTRSGTAGRRGSEPESPGVAAVAVIAATIAVGGPDEWFDEFRGGDVAQGSGRLAELSSNNRWTWWQESWELFRDEPAGGHGAHTFEIARRPLRVGSVVTEEPHNLGVQSLAELGVVGLLLGIGAAGLALLACCGGREATGRRRAGGGFGARRAAARLPAARAGRHRLGLRGRLGAGPGSGRRAAVRRPPAGRAAEPSAAGTRCGSRRAGRPLLDHGAVDLAAEGRGRVLGHRERRCRRRASAARQARDLNPLSVEPLWAWALAEATARNPGGTVERYLEATELQPENSDTWFALGAYEFELRRYRDAYVHLDRSYGLDPYGPAGLPGGLLDQARAKVEGR